jgi:hypothetical protein
MGGSAFLPGMSGDAAVKTRPFGQARPIRESGKCGAFLSRILKPNSPPMNNATEESMLASQID